MRLCVLALALFLIPTSVQAQDVEAVFSALTDFALESSDDDDEADGICGTSLFGVTEEDAAAGNTGFSCAEWAVIVGGTVAVCAGAVGALYIASRCQDNGDLSSARGGSVRWVEEDVRSRNLVLRVVRSQPRGLGDGTAEAPITIRAFDAETRQPVALGPLGSTTATVRTADDLRTLLEDR